MPKTRYSVHRLLPWPGLHVYHHWADADEPAQVYERTERQANWKNDKRGIQENGGSNGKAAWELDYA